LPRALAFGDASCASAFFVMMYFPTHESSAPSAVGGAAQQAASARRTPSMRRDMGKPSSMLHPVRGRTPGVAFARHARHYSRLPQRLQRKNGAHHPAAGRPPGEPVVPPPNHRAVHGGSLLPIRLALLVELEPFPGPLAARLFVLGHPQGLLLVLDRLLVLPGLGTGGREGVDGVAVLPGGQLAGPPGVGEGLLAVAVL